MSRAGSPFSPRVVLAVLVVGAGALLLLLYAIGAGWNGRSDRNGGAHAAANGLNGFAGLARLLEARGHRVELSRNEGRLDDEGLLVLTPQIFTDGEEIAEIVEARRYVGPTLLILPKWIAGRVDGVRTLDVPKGWVALAGSEAPDWLKDLDGFDDVKLQLGERRRWEGLGLAGALPQPDQVLTLSASRVMPLATDEKGDVLAGYLDDGGAYPVLDAAAGMPPRDAEEFDLDPDRWSLVVVVEPDLLNNYGMADRTRAELAEKIVEAAKEGQDLPVVFDLTSPASGRARTCSRSRSARRSSPPCCACCSPRW